MLPKPNHEKYPFKLKKGKALRSLFTLKEKDSSEKREAFRGFSPKICLSCYVRHALLVGKEAIQRSVEFEEKRRHFAQFLLLSEIQSWIGGVGHHLITHSEDSRGKKRMILSRQWGVVLEFHLTSPRRQYPVIWLQSWR